MRMRRRLVLGGSLLLMITLIGSPAFSPSHYPPPPPDCQVLQAQISGPSEARVGEPVRLKGQARASEDCEVQYTWGLREAPEGAPHWQASGPQVTLIPKLSGLYTIELEARVGQSAKRATHRLSVQAQEYAIIVANNEVGRLQTFPDTLVVPSGSLRLFLTALEGSRRLELRQAKSGELSLRLEVDAGTLTVVEVMLAPGVYTWVDGSTQAELGILRVR